MRIRKLIFEDKKRNWKLEETEFGQLTLLVGASGVGKTRILKAIDSLKDIASGQVFEGISWTLEFETLDGKNYQWVGETNILDKSKFIPAEVEQKVKDKDNTPKAEFVFEKLLCGTKVIIDRTVEKIIFDGKEMPKLSPSESLLSILKKEDLINPVKAALSKIVFKNHSSANGASPDFLGVVGKDWDLPKYSSIQILREADMLIKNKLYITRGQFPDLFEEILDAYKDIFPQIEGLEFSESPLNDKISWLNIRIKEKGVVEWIDEDDVSSGMLRSLIHLCEIFLCPDGSVFLIDEFENSLGINCIDELTSHILGAGRQIQFIITSHHPYIINNIDFLHWRLVTRNGGKVKVSLITDFISGRSSHDKFMQLIQLTQYQTGQN